MLLDCAYCGDQPFLEKEKATYFVQWHGKMSYRYICDCEGGHHSKRFLTKKYAAESWNDSQEAKLVNIRKIQYLQSIGLIKRPRLRRK